MSMMVPRKEQKIEQNDTVCVYEGGMKSCLKVQRKS